VKCQPNGVGVSLPGSSDYEQADQRFDAADNVRYARRDGDFVENPKDFDGSLGLSEFVAAPQQKEKSQAHSEEKQCSLLFLLHPRPPEVYAPSEGEATPLYRVSDSPCLLQTGRSNYERKKLRVFIAHFPELRQ
jgi:hypothetical protein